MEADAGEFHPQVEPESQVKHQELISGAPE